MNIDNSLWTYFADAGAVVKVVMSILLAASIVSWTLIFQRGFFLKRTRHALTTFENKFWSGADLTKLYSETGDHHQEFSGLETIFRAGFKEYFRLSKLSGNQTQTVVEGAQRAMRIAQARAMDKLEQHLAILATIGSTSPYVGLFGTVWGIMTSFHALGSVQQASIAMVAPGISEALIATAMGLFAAIPAVVAYNRFANDVERLNNQFETFQDEFTAILYRQANGT